MIHLEQASSSYAWQNSIYQCQNIEITYSVSHYRSFLDKLKNIEAKHGHSTQQHPYQDIEF